MLYRGKSTVVLNLIREALYATLTLCIHSFVKINCYLTEKLQENEIFWEHIYPKITMKSESVMFLSKQTS